MSETVTKTAAPADAPKPRWMFLIAIAAFVLVTDQVSKFLAVRNLTTVIADAKATGLGAQLSVWLSQKHLMANALMPTETQPFIGAFWSWRYAENPGAAFSFAHAWPESVRVPFFHLVSVIAVVLIAFYYRRLKPEQGLLKLALALVMGGAIGNLVDRLIRGYVIDFIDWHLNDHFWARPAAHWPTFNVADTGISVGVALIFLDTVLAWFAQKKQAKTATPRPADTSA